MKAQLAEAQGELADAKEQFDGGRKYGVEELRRSPRREPCGHHQSATTESFAPWLANADDGSLYVHKKTSHERIAIMANPCERGGRVYHGTRVDLVWSEEDEAAFFRTAALCLHLPLVMALWTGQRQGDLLRLPWSAYDGQDIRLRQSKTGAAVLVPVGAPL
jgi:hypothetical protein